MFQGTTKYISSPVANVVFSTEAELPMLTICHQRGLGPMPGDLTKRDLIHGKFFPDDSSDDFDVDQMFEKAMQEYDYFLNLTGKMKDYEDYHIFKSCLCSS